MFSIKTLDKRFIPEITELINNKTKPLGSLGQLEQLALQLALLQSQQKKQVVLNIKIKQPTMIVFAGDHHIAKHGISIAPSEVTRQMVLNFLTGGAAINCFCKTNDIEMKVVDTGIITPLSDVEKALNSNFIEQRLGNGIGDISTASAMTSQKVEQGLAFGQKIAEETINNGCNTLLLGEMGIGNTSSASAILSALSDERTEKFVGKGTGINEEQFLLKKQLIEKSIQRIDQNKANASPEYLLKELAGFEIVQMVGAILGAAAKGVPTLIDGFIVTSAALVAVKINPAVRDYLIFSHQSNEQAHQTML
ncbi:MAG: nicotinate-nucleotide--dimethylbenzimidazole phosphoribosyltransferase, partial [Colwelliaceae bacterium]|nr:nicotinate-nucleotide--dimethylbenzimidazole phosphoribosyltransferase [Colwelliaceae bacterium]